MNATEELVHIPAGKAVIEGALRTPAQARGVVLFAHGSGSSRHSPRNNVVARILNNNHFATLLMDLLTPEEDEDYDTRFDIELLTQRLVIATAWVRNNMQPKGLPIAYFGASTGAAAALKAAVKEGSIDAVVSRGGRPDLAEDALGRVVSPVLLLVGSHDFWSDRTERWPQSLIHRVAAIFRRYWRYKPKILELTGSVMAVEKQDCHQ